MCTEWFDLGNSSVKGFLSGDFSLFKLTGKAIRAPGHYRAPGHHLAFFGVESILSTAISKKADSDQRTERRPQPESPPTIRERHNGIWVRLMLSYK